ncbi:hypothetical protein HHI36_008801 [Cryptolaemus montrouzieri]|uniref:Uncharacterized protein n=1 Tax=Cryptolaemus montrouzieri TaxID=559131 RepID=A0ABD2MUD6_9CUCU
MGCWPDFRAMKAAQKEMKEAITTALWRELLRKLNTDMWGERYRIVTRHFMGSASHHKLPVETLKKILAELFSLAARNHRRRQEACHKSKKSAGTAGTEVRPSKTIKYLGVIFQLNLSFAHHIDEVVEKADESCCLHLQADAQRGRPCVLKETYIAQSDPQHPLVCGSVQKCSLFKVGGWLQGNRKIAKKRTLVKWQERWKRGDIGTAELTRTLIGKIAPWIECGHRRAEYFFNQVLTGHSSFDAYTHRIGKTSTD